VIANFILPCKAKKGDTKAFTSIIPSEACSGLGEIIFLSLCRDASKDGIAMREAAVGSNDCAMPKRIVDLLFDTE
jgi:hypothetical protein